MRRRLGRRTRGSVHVETLVVLVFVTILAAAAVRTVGPSLAALLRARIAWLALPVP